MQKYEQMLGSVIVGGFVVIIVADTLRHIIWYLVVLAVLLYIFRLLLGNR
jgi:hypothetical protein